MATRILAHRGLLAPGGRIAALVGSEVVYLAGRGVSPATMTPYDVCAVRLADGTVLAGVPPDDADLYLRALAGPSRAAARTALEIVTAPDLTALVAGLCRTSWDEAEGDARAAGALVGAYPAGAE